MILSNVLFENGFIRISARFDRVLLATATALPSVLSTSSQVHSIVFIITMCGRTCSRRRVALTAAQRAIETATQAQSYLFEKPDNVVPSLGSVENELPPVYTEVWDEKNQSARDVGYGTGSQVGQSSDIQGQQASISGYDSRITTAKMGTY